MRSRRTPSWLALLVLVAAGAGAAVGPTLAPRLTGRVAVTATQAVTIRRVPTAATSFDGLAASQPINETNPAAGLLTGQPGILVPLSSMSSAYGSGRYLMTAEPDLTYLPSGTRSYVSLNDTGTQFTIALDMLPTSSKFDVVVSLNNSSNNQVLADLNLDIPDGLTIDIEKIAIQQPGGGGPVDAKAGKVSLGRMSPNSWELTLAANTGNYDDILSRTDGGGFGVGMPASGFIMHVAMANGTPPGFFQIQGTLQAKNV